MDSGMSNKQRGEFKVCKDIIVKFTLGSLVEIEQELGLKNLTEIADINWQSIKIVSKLLWIGMKFKQPDITYQDVLDLDIPYTKVPGIIAEAVLYSLMGESDPNVKKPLVKK